MTDERTVKVEFTEEEARTAASALSWGSYIDTPLGFTTFRKIRNALLPPEPVTEEAPPPEKPKRGRPRKAPAEK